MIKETFAICKHKETGEYHVFRTKKNKDDECVFEGNTSLCGAMSVKDKEHCIAACRTEDEIMKKAASVGDDMCGNCMKTIYKTDES